VIQRLGDDEQFPPVALRHVQALNVASHGLSLRLQFRPGSFFTDPLPQDDVIMMSHILHD